MPDTLVGLDELIRSELEKFAAHWFWALLGFTLLVALGLMFEFPEILHDTVGALKEICRCPTVKRKLSPKAKLLGTFGWILIIAGVVGEGVAEGFLFKADGLVLKFDEILLADTTKSAGAARASAKQAANAAEFANGQAKRAKDEADAVAKQAEEIDSDLARTQYLLSGRSVTDPDSLVKQLRQYKWQTANFGSYNSEPDEIPLCRQLVSAARSAEMNVPQDACGRQFPIGGPPLTGIVISGPDVAETMALAQIILHTSNLGAAGVQSGLSAPELTILVGAKPLFVMGQARGVKAQKNNAHRKQRTKP
jgi:hypothetical protein